MIPADLKYSTEHEWVAADSQSVTIGITDYAQSQLGDITYVELPHLGKVFKVGDSVAVVESVKAASEVYAPVSGSVTAVNEDLEGCPDKVNSDPYKEGWLFKLSGVKPSDLEGLMNAKEYETFLEKGDA